MDRKWAKRVLIYAFDGPLQKRIGGEHCERAAFVGTTEDHIMQQVTVDEAKAHLIDLIDAAVAGEEILITQDGGLSVQLVPHVIKTRKRQFGSAKGLISMAPDFEAPLDEFKEYME